MQKHIIYVTSMRETLYIRLLRARLALRSSVFIVVTDDAQLAASLLALHTQNPHAAVEVTLEHAADFQRVRRIWESLDSNSALELFVKLDTPACVNQSKQLLIDLDHSSVLNLQNQLDVLARDGQVVLITSRALIFWPERISALILSADPAPTLLRNLQYVSVMGNSRIVFTSIPVLKRIPRSFWKRLFVSSLPAVMNFHDDGGLSPLRLFAAQSPETLFVFPERMLPLTRAYYLRAFDLMLGLAYSGHAPAVLVLGPRNDELKQIHRVLEIFSPAVTTEPLVRGRFPIKHKIVRWVERGLRRCVGLTPAAPRRYCERGMVFATKANAILLCNLVESLPALKNVVYTGAWFAKAVSFVQSRHSEFRWFCDTHDVFFVLDNSGAKEDRHFFYSAERQRRMEIDDLKLADVIIAISPSDRDALSSTDLSRQCIVEPGSFSHVYPELQTSVGGDPRLFGFVGSNNKNNQKCLNLIRNVWWPIIRRSRPKSHLQLVGAICLSEEAALLIQEYPDSVSSLGFVDSINSFYSMISVVLSPIEVQGGLNFKSVEALMAGCFLLTNARGSNCLGKDARGVSIVDDDGGNLPAILDQLLIKLDDANERVAIRSSATLVYGDNVAYSELFAKLSNVI